MRCGIPNDYILDITMYKIHVLLCSYYTIRILISKTLTGTYEGGYTCVFEMCCYRQRWILLYIYCCISLYITIYCYIYIYIVAISNVVYNNTSQIHTCNLLHMYQLKF